MFGGGPFGGFGGGGGGGGGPPSGLGGYVSGPTDDNNNNNNAYGGFGGGGGGGGATQPNQGPPQPAAVQTLTPVTIRMLLDSFQQQKTTAGGNAGGPDAAFMVNGRELGMLTLVASVESVKVQPTFRIFDLNDSTGRIEVRIYRDSQEVDGEDDLKVGEYVRIYGHCRAWGGQEQVSCHHIARIESANEIAFHMIEVAHVHLSLNGRIVKPAAPGGQNTMPAGGNNTMGGGFSAPQQSMPPPPGGASGMFGGVALPVAQTPTPGSNPYGGGGWQPQQPPQQQHNPFQVSGPGMGNGGFGGAGQNAEPGGFGFGGF
nr:replication protein A 32 kDa subunit [Crypthecodinium cohnii]